MLETLLSLSLNSLLPHPICAKCKRDRGRASLPTLQGWHTLQGGPSGTYRVLPWRRVPKDKRGWSSVQMDQQASGRALCGVIT